MQKGKPSIVKAILKRFLLPQHLWKVIALQRNRKKIQRVYDDAQLKLYHQLLPGDFLHYGYFDNAQTEPADVSLNMIYRAQERYAEKLLELVKDTQSPILDIGCGMGGMLGMMNKRGWKSTGLTPDKNQCKHIREKYPNDLIEARFEDIDSTKYASYFGTVITSESFQYLKTDVALPLIKKILKPGGRWVACDYFRIGEAEEKSGHRWEQFLELLEANQLTLVEHTDITTNVLPTIAYVYFLATQVGLPIKEFIEGKLEVKAPGIHYALQEALPLIEEKIDKNVRTITPDIFAANKRYVLMVIEPK
ncbi:MAG: methyltransferase domain-containing protein [Chitinophagales bacterium]